MRDLRKAFLRALSKQFDLDDLPEIDLPEPEESEEERKERRELLARMHASLPFVRSYIQRCLRLIEGMEDFCESLADDECPPSVKGKILADLDRLEEWLNNADDRLAELGVPEHP